MRFIPRTLSILLLFILTACGAVIRFDNLSIELPDRATSIPTVTTTPSQVPSPTASPTTISSPTVTTLVNLNLRASASINSPILAVIPATTTIQLFGRSADSAWLAVQYGSRQGWVSSASNLVGINGGILSSLPIISQLPITPTQDPTPTQERPKARISYNVNAQAIPSRPALEAHLLELCPTTLTVMEDFSYAVQLYNLLRPCGTIVIHRAYSILEGSEWFYRSPQNWIDQWRREGHPEIVRYSTNEPSFGGNQSTALFVSTEVELMRLARLNGFTVAMGNFSVGIVRPEDINAGVYDTYIRALAQYGHYLALHEYAVVALPFGVGQWQTSFLQDRNRVQPASWPLPASLPTCWASGLAPYWYLMRGVWFLCRADTIGAARPHIILTEFGWDNLPNIKPEIEPLRQQFGLDKYFRDMSGINTYPNVWAWYWPQWNFAQAACEQLMWADEIYPADYIGFNLFTWSLNPHWRHTDFSGRENPALFEVQDCLESYAAN